MIQLIASILALSVHAKIHARASESSPVSNGDGPVVYITKDNPADGRTCEIKSLNLQTKAAPHSNEIANRLIVDLRKPRGIYLECPASVTINLESRAEAMKLYELVRSTKKLVCQSSSSVSSARVVLACDIAFELTTSI